MDKYQEIFQELSQSIKQLEKALNQPKDEFIRDSAIKRFEMAFDLAWKTLKTYLEIEKGLVCHSPKDCFRQAYQAKVIDYDEFWLEITDWRNETVHIYDEDLAEKIYKILPKVLTYFQQLNSILVKKP